MIIDNETMNKAIHHTKKNEEIAGKWNFSANQLTTMSIWINIHEFIIHLFK